jgi:RNA ligase
VTATTGIHWTDLFTPQLLDEALQGGYIRVQQHPTLPLVIYNYTEKTAYEGAWDAATLACRGLIVEVGSGRVVARPLIKFFNHSQPGAPAIPLDAPVHVTDKADGSLGILYPTPDGWAVATRGSFTSEQALHATAVLRTRYGHWAPRPEQTVLVEICYPANRIVINYGSLDDLILIGAVDTATGAVLDPSRVGGWPGPSVATFTAATLADALAMEPRPNAEGVVVRDLDTGHMVKIKQADYVALHRIVTGLNARTVWQHLVDGKPLAALIEPLPDEFHPWVRQVADTLAAQVDAEAAEASAAYAAILESLPLGPARPGEEDGFTRKDFAALAVRSPWKWALFLTLDGRDILPELWKRARPEPFWTPSGRVYTEDTA